MGCPRYYFLPSNNYIKIYIFKTLKKKNWQILLSRFKKIDINQIFWFSFLYIIVQSMPEIPKLPDI